MACGTRSTSPPALPRRISFLLLLHNGLRADLGIPAWPGQPGQPRPSKGGHWAPAPLSSVSLSCYPHFLQNLSRAKPFAFQYSLSHTAPRSARTRATHTHTVQTHTHTVQTHTSNGFGQCKHTPHTQTHCAHSANTDTPHTHARSYIRRVHTEIPRTLTRFAQTRGAHTRTACTRTAYTCGAHTQSSQQSHRTLPIQTTHTACSCRPRVHSPTPPRTHPLHAQAH